MENTEFIPVNEPYIPEESISNVMNCLKTGWISSEGSYVKQFEEEMANLISKDFGVATSSGTAALDIAFKSIELKSDDEVILPTFTIISCASEIIRSGAKPIFIDCNEKTFNIDAKNIEKLITKKTKAILCAHIYGLTSNMAEIRKICDRNKIILIEDLSESIGQITCGEQCGYFGDISVMSFYANKNISTGEGGMLLTNNSNLYERAKSLRNLCFQKERRFLHKEIGWNYRMTNIQAALGLGQVSALEKNLLIRHKIAEIYYYYLEDFDFIQLPIKKTNYCKNSFWVFSLLIKDKRFNARFLSNELLKSGVQSRPFFYPLHLQPIIPQINNKKYKVAEFISEYGLYLPSGIGTKLKLIEESAKRVKAILNFQKNYK